VQRIITTIIIAIQIPGAAAEAVFVTGKYSSLTQSYVFVPVAAETMEPSTRTDGLLERPWKAHHTKHR